MPVLGKYDYNHHIENKNGVTVDLLEALRAKIFSLSSSIEEYYYKMYIGYSEGKKFCEICVNSSQLKVWVGISVDEVYDPAMICRDVRAIGHYGTGNTEMTVKNFSDITQAFDIIKQAYGKCKVV